MVDAHASPGNFPELAKGQARDKVASFVGSQRIAAYRHLGRKDIPVTVVDLDDVVRGEFAENMARKAFTPTEEVAIFRALAPAEKAAAKERQGTRNDLTGTSGKVSHKSPERSLDKVAAYVGKSGRTLEKQVELVEAAEADRRGVRRPGGGGEVPRRSGCWSTR